MALQAASDERVSPGRARSKREGAIARARTALTRRAQGPLTEAGLLAMFQLMDARLRLDAGYRRLIFRKDGPVRDDWRAKILLTARDGAFELGLTIGGGRARCRRGRLDAPDATLCFRDANAARALLTESPARALEMLLTGELVFSGNLSHVARLSFMLNALVDELRRRGRPEVPFRQAVELPKPRRALPMARSDEAPALEDPAFSGWSVRDFPRLERLLVDHFAVTPQICTERPRLYTDHMRAQGFDTGAPVLRQARAFRHVMENKAALVREGDLLAGTTGSKPVSVIVYPECGGIPIWPELSTIGRRKLNPYRIAPEDVAVLNEVFPFWIDRNVREYARARHENPLSIQLDERFVFYFLWKTQAISHTIPDFPAVLSRGLHAIRDEALAHAQSPPPGGRRELYQAMAISLDGVMSYAARLSHEAAAQARRETDPARRSELEGIAMICAKVPAEPAETLHEALQSIWITWIGCHMENTNAGLSIGRLDQWLQPFFEADLRRLPAGDASAHAAYLHRALELLGCFWLRCTDHLPQVADLGNKLFGGSSSDQVITLGGVRADGESGVNDMTYLCLKVTEMLGLRDPNVNARYYEGKNSPEYLARLCELNYLTGATPSIHNDRALIDVLVDQGLELEHARDWSATGCVEPTSCGRHYGHTNCMMFNLVAPLEMALRDGFHPLVGERIGPRTGTPDTFATFEQLFDAYLQQLKQMIALATDANNLLAEAHASVRPTPFLSAIFQGPMQNGRDLVEGGARYNGSGSGNVGLADVIDSLSAIRQLVFDERRLELATLLAATDADFAGFEPLLARIEHRVPKFGSGHPGPLELAHRILAATHQAFRARPHFRGGRYNAGYWSMSNHVAFGILSGALPSGRRRGKAFTPGLTPSPARGATIVDQIHDLAQLDHRLMPNNIAFNVKLVPGPDDSQAVAVSQMAAYARTYVQQGGMQLQFNVVSSATLRDAMAHPELYRTLMVRISGYNAYFVDLNDDMKRELIERAEHRLGA
jgi:pyruvate formate-lyase/glycerol dehydratase family glycyl radical enzyme